MQVLRRRRLVLLATLGLSAGLATVLVLASAPSTASRASAPTAAPRSHVVPVAARRAQERSVPRFPDDVAVGLRTFTFIDRHRTIRFLNGSVGPRTLVTEVRYPAVGHAGGDDLLDAPPLRAAGPYPLIVFGHGFAVTPDVYRTLLDFWARSGYVVAAPVFQLGSPLAPGGPNEADLVNWPLDMSFVISQMLDESTRRGGALAALIERDRIAVSGQSDGGDTALAISFDPALRDRRVDAALILSGAEIPQLGSFAFPAHGPPLLATQGSADTINLPSATQAFFTAAPRPKFLLTMLGAPHLPPYTTEEPYLGIIERVTSAFLNAYLKGQRTALGSMRSAGSVHGESTLQADS